MAMAIKHMALLSEVRLPNVMLRVICSGLIVIALSLHTLYGIVICR